MFTTELFVRKISLDYKTDTIYNNFNRKFSFFKNQGQTSIEVAIFFLISIYIQNWHAIRFKSNLLLLEKRS